MEQIVETDAQNVPHSNALPILAYREKILEMVRTQFITVIQGDTGCGKSSQVPQMILQDCRERGVANPLIICTQPRRIAAVSLANRVATELKEPLGRTVGYMIGADRCIGRNTEIRFVTTGWAFEKLVHDELFMGEITHFVLDEVHERSIDADLLHLLIKLVLPKVPVEKRPRIVLMSATFDAGMFADYYAPNDPPKTLFVGLQRYPVETFYLEQFASYAPLRSLANIASQLSSQMTDAKRRLGTGGPANTLFLKVIRTLHEYHAPRGEPCCVLVFLSGIAEIDALWEHIEEMEHDEGAVENVSDEELSYEDEKVDNEPKPVQPGDTGAAAGAKGNKNSSNNNNMYERKTPPKKQLARFQLCMLHSSVDKDDQMVVFSDIPQGKTRIVLTTNIAESSVTIPNARYVIDSGFHRHMAFDERLGCTSLVTVPISQAAAKQRRGRTGRLFPGVVLRFYSESFFNGMQPYEEPDMLRLPLFNTVLRLKVAAQEETGFISPLARPSEALSYAISPPTHAQVIGAYTELFKHGHMTPGHSDDPDDSVVTPLGRFLQKLNLDIRLGSLVVTALVLFPDYLPHAIVLAVSMSMQNVFVHANPRTGGMSMENQTSFFEMVATIERHRSTFNGTLFSDPLTCLRVVGQVPPNLSSPGPWYHQRGLHTARMQQLHSQAVEIAQKLAPLVPASLVRGLESLMQRNLFFELSDTDVRVVKFLMAFSLPDMIVAADLKIKDKELSNPSKVDFPSFNVPYADWTRCVFFPKKVPVFMVSIGGALEKLLLEVLFKKHNVRYKVHVGNTGKFQGENVASVAVEFDTAADAMFAQVVLEGCSKNGKIQMWISNDDKITLPAPVKRTNWSHTVVLNNGCQCNTTGSSALNYLSADGYHFLLPSQAVYVNTTLMVEDLTWLSGKDEWVWNTLAMLPTAQAVSSTSIAIGKTSLADVYSFDKDRLARLMYLKHLAHAAVTTQFSVSGRADIGAEICRVVLGIDPKTVEGLKLKKVVTPEAAALAASKKKGHRKNNAKVLVISAVTGGAEDFKMNVVKSLTLQSICAVAAAKVIGCAPHQVNVRVARTGKVLASDELLAEALSTEGDAFGVLRVEAMRKGTLVLGAGGTASGGAAASPSPDLPEPVVGIQDEASRVSLLASAAPLAVEAEDDEWLLRTAIECLMTQDGRMKVEILLATIHFRTRTPERVTKARLIDIARTEKGKKQLMYDSMRGTFVMKQTRDEEGASGMSGDFIFSSPMSGEGAEFGGAGGFFGANSFDANNSNNNDDAFAVDDGNGNGGGGFAFGVAPGSGGGGGSGSKGKRRGGGGRKGKAGDSSIGNLSKQFDFMGLE